MNHIEDQIKKRTQSTIEKVILRAQKIKEREIILARKKREELILEGKKNIDETVNIKKKSLKSQLELEYRMKEGKFKEDISLNLLNEVKDALNHLDDNTLIEAHKNLIREAVLVLGIKKALIKVNRKVYSIIKEHYEEIVNFIKEKMGDFESFEIDDSLDSYGVIVSSLEGKEFFNNTFKRRFERFDNDFKEKILTALQKHEG